MSSCHNCCQGKDDSWLLCLRVRASKFRELQRREFLPNCHLNKDNMSVENQDFPGLVSYMEKDSSEMIILVRMQEVAFLGTQNLLELVNFRGKYLKSLSYWCRLGREGVSLRDMSFSSLNNTDLRMLVKSHSVECDMTVLSEATNFWVYSRQHRM
ncbi:hypothetical protein J6590_029956 [Homalodisca vitripennis]|nr:hypothetical protein J6590_029956 [Homalodisca vitripennis]